MNKENYPTDKPNIDKRLFWDTDPNTIDFDKHSRYVIDKVVRLGQIEDWREILRFYGPERIKNEVTQILWLDDKTLYFLSHYFKVPLEDFKCYRHKQSIPVLYPVQ